MCFDTDSDAADPRHRRRGRLARRPRARRRPTATQFAAFLATPDEPATTGHRHPARRARALPLLRGARAALRRARPRRDRDRLLRPHRRRREARRRLRVHAARRADDGRRASRPTSRAAVEQLRDAGRDVDLHRRLLLRRPRTRGSRPRRGTASPARSASTAARRASAAVAERRRSAPREMTCPILALQAGDDQNITAEDNAAFDAGARGRRRRARDRHLRRRAAQLLRPQAGGVRRRVRRRVAADARVRRAHS